MVSVHSAQERVVPPEQGQQSAGHTPGPWVELETETSVDLDGCGGWQDVGPDGGGPVAIVLFRDVSVYGDGNSRGDANIRLVAAAPEMLDALRYAENTIVAMRPTFSQVKDEGHAYHDQVLDTVRAAIAKATGAAS